MTNYFIVQELFLSATEVLFPCKCSRKCMEEWSHIFS